MRELLILLSSTSSSSTLTPPNPNHHHSPKPKAKHSSSSCLSAVRYDLPPARRNHHHVLSHCASTLAGVGRTRDVAAIAESLISSGVDASRLAAELSAKPFVAEGISKSVCEGNVRDVVEILRRVEKLGLPPLKLLDGAAVESLKKACLRIVESADVDEIVVLMETLSGFGFPIKELVAPSRIIKICVDKRSPKMAVRYACLLPRERILLCDLINEFGKRGDLDSALTAYEEIKDTMIAPNMYLYRTVIDVCGFCGDYMKSRYIYEDLLNRKITPNIYVINSLMNVNAHDLAYTLHVYKNIENLGATADMASYNILLKACCRAGRVDLAQDIYKEVKQLESNGLLKLDVFTYCTIIKVFADAKLWQMALKVKEDMLSSGVTPNTFTWSSLISACANAGLVDQAIQLFEEMLLAGCEPNSQCCNILLHACVEACQYDRAFRLFESWKANEVLDASGKDSKDNDEKIASTEHAQKQSINTVTNLVSTSHHMNFIKKFPFKPTLTTYNTLMKACGTDFLRAKALINEMKSVGLSPNHISWTILIDICGASGNMEGALQILNNMHVSGVDPDVITYTTVIKICVERKNLGMAFSLYDEMKRYQIKPNLVTYNTLLKARTRYGSLRDVQQCLAIYQDMRKAGYKGNDYYLKQLIEEWCEGVLQEDGQLTACRTTDFWRPHGLLLEKVTAHLRSSIANSLAIDIQGLTKIEARIVVLVVLRMIKENFSLGHTLKDDMWITLGVKKVDELPAKHESEVKDAVLELLENELGLEVLVVVPRSKVDINKDQKNPPDSDSDLAGRFVRSTRMVSSTRRPLDIQRLKVTKRSLQHWLLRRVAATRR